MNARAQFKAARSLYRHGMRIAPVFVPGNVDSNFGPDRIGRKVRPECEQAMAMASRLHPKAPQFIGRAPAAPFVSTLRTLYRHNNPRMHADNGFGSRNVGYPYKRHALNELRTGLLFASKAILPGPVAPLAELCWAEDAIRARRILTYRFDLDATATRDAAVALGTIRMGFEAIFGKKAA